MKYIDADKLIDIIEKLESTFKKLEKTIGREEFFKGKREMAVQTRSIITSLQQEQPEVDLENELDKSTIVRRLQGWVARDRNGELNLHLTKPSKRIDDWFNLYCIALDREQFQELKWSDQSLEVEVVIGLNGKK